MKTAVFGGNSGEPSSPCGAPPSLTFTPSSTLVPPSSHHHHKRNQIGGGGGNSERGGGERSSGGTATGPSGQRPSHSSRRTSRMHNVSALGVSF
ncbi:unnamed protein product [Caenorhabditis angaria]|uniref:Uncharacterized protein n=1 Tax=Caenorhabditis angaria TaxID=860376 RepID=A0A9P1IJG1_9PELO|nr:unnamed protein product [Caenorhabditis angaria]